jgi:hypothetical protein
MGIPLVPAVRWSGQKTLPDGLTLAGEALGDYVGYVVDPQGDVTGDAHPDLVIASAARSGGLAVTGTVYVVPGPITDDLSLATDAFGLYGIGQPGEATPSAGWLGDIDGDGVGDLIVGEPATTTSGDVHIVRGPVTASATLNAPDGAWTGEDSADGAGVDVAAAGDVTGDGLPDVLVGAYRASGTNTFEAGAVYVLAGPAWGPGTLADAACIIRGERVNDHLGTAVVGDADFDGDGVSDIAMGADSPGGRPTGGVYVVRGPMMGEWEADLADARLFGGNAWNWPGRFRGTIDAGDLDGDGLADLAVGDHHDGENGGDDLGSVSIVMGPDLVGEIDLDDAAVILSGVSVDDSAGSTVDTIGDVDGDGQGELLVGSPGAQPYGFGSGRAYLVYGPWMGSSTLADAAAAWWDGPDNAWWVGYGLAGGADLTGDGTPDLVLGARGADGDEEDSGSVYLLPGVPSH